MPAFDQLREKLSLPIEERLRREFLLRNIRKLGPEFELGHQLMVRAYVGALNDPSLAAMGIMCAMVMIGIKFAPDQMKYFEDCIQGIKDSPPYQDGGA